MKAWVVLISSIWMLGCGRIDHPEYPYSCSTKCFASIQAIHSINCRNVIRDEQWVIGFWEKSLLPINRACGFFKNVRVVIRDEQSFWKGKEELSGMNLDGLYYLDDKRIEVARSVSELAHEMIHAYEDIKGIDNPQDPHRGWAGNEGYQKLVSDYENIRCSVDPSVEPDRNWCF